MRNRVTEKEVRDHLSALGFDGRGARFSELDLVAIERPGWLQVFRVSVAARRADGAWHQLYGAVRDDQLRRAEIELYRSTREQDQLLERWSSGLITLRRRTYSHGETVFLLLFWLVFVAVVVAGLLGQ